MRQIVALVALALLPPLLCVPSAVAAGGDEVAKLKAQVEQLVAENKSLKVQVARLMEQLAAQKKPLPKTEVVIDIDGLEDIRIGEKKHTLTSLRQQFESAPPGQVVLRSKGSTTGVLQTGMEAFLKRARFTKDAELGTEQIWVRSVSPAKGP